MSVYFVKSERFVKIGYSSKPMSRITALQTSSPYKIELLMLMPGNAAVEHEFHSVFADYHHFNEWYHYDGDLVDFIEYNARFFRDYTAQFQANNQYQDERDWEYWKDRALRAEAGSKYGIDKHEEIEGTRLQVYEIYQRNPEATQQEVADEIGISRQAVGKHVRSLNGKLKG